MQMAWVVGLCDFEIAPAEGDLAGVQYRSRRFNLTLKHPVVAVTRPPTQRIFEHRRDVEPGRKWLDAASGMRRVIDERRVHSRLQVSTGSAGQLRKINASYGALSAF